MFCLKCGELIPDDAEKCPVCGTAIDDKAEQTVIYASRQEPLNENKSSVVPSNYTPWLVVICLAIASLAFLALNYMSISIDLLYSSSSITSYTGYYLTQCLGGTARLSGIMIIVLIVLNIISIITAFIGIKYSSTHGKALRIVLLIEVVLYLVVTILPYFHISSLLNEFDASLTTTSIGLGCYLNMGVAILMTIIYFSCLSKQLKWQN